MKTAMCECGALVDILCPVCDERKVPEMGPEWDAIHAEQDAHVERLRLTQPEPKANEWIEARRTAGYLLENNPQGAVHGRLVVARCYLALLKRLKAVDEAGLLFDETEPKP